MSNISSDVFGFRHSQSVVKVANPYQELNACLENELSPLNFFLLELNMTAIRPAISTLVLI